MTTPIVAQAEPCVSNSLARRVRICLAVITSAAGAQRTEGVARVGADVDGGENRERRMLDHVSIPVRDTVRAAAFYDPVLAAVGLGRVKEVGGAIGYGRDAGWPMFWLEPDLAPERGKSARAGIGLHISFRASSRAEVHAFHAAALAHGGRDAGAPGPRPQYSSGFYGAFAFDPDGFKVEAVVREEL